jgi:hypothetical protein
MLYCMYDHIIRAAHLNQTVNVRARSDAHDTILWDVRKIEDDPVIDGSVFINTLLT